MVVCLLLDLGLKAAFAFKGEVVLEDRDPLDQPPDQCLSCNRHFGNRHNMQGTHNSKIIDSFSLK